MINQREGSPKDEPITFPTITVCMHSQVIKLNTRFSRFIQSFQHSKAKLNEHYPQLNEILDDHGQSVLLRQFYGSGIFFSKIDHIAPPKTDRKILQI